MSRPGTITIAHVSDLHIGAHDPASVGRLLAAVAAARPTVTVVTGDLTMRARAREFRAAAAVLAALPRPLLAVPGNHDIPLYDPLTRLLAPYRGYLDAIPGGLAPVVDAPGVRVLGIASMPGWRWKSGRIDDGHCATVRGELAGTPQWTVRVLALHHPLMPHAWWGLAGRGRLLRALGDARVDLVLAGHTHLPATRRVQLPAGAFVEVVAGTATSVRIRRGVGRSWSLVTVSPGEVVVTHHATDTGTTTVARYPRLRLTRPG